MPTFLPSTGQLQVGEKAAFYLRTRHLERDIQPIAREMVIVRHFFCVYKCCELWNAMATFLSGVQKGCTSKAKREHGKRTKGRAQKGTSLPAFLHWTESPFVSRRNTPRSMKIESDENLSLLSGSKKILARLFSPV